MTTVTTLDEIVQWFESITPETVAQVAQFYGDDAYFKDPFQEVRGVAAVTHVYGHMFKQVVKPRFKVQQRFHAANGEVMLTWDFLFEMRGKPQVVRGTTHLQFAADGRINSHRDYWDVAEELYEKLPVLGSLMRFLKRQAAK